MTALRSQSLDTDERVAAFLGVERSARDLRWIERLTPDREQSAMAMAQEHGFAEILARVLAARGVERDTVANYLTPTLRNLRMSATLAAPSTS